MLRPSYAELMKVLNEETEGDEEITSRYTIVIATAKRARQIIDGDEPMISMKKGKPVSIAVEELYHSKIKVVPEGKGTILNISGKEDIFENKNTMPNTKIKHNVIEYIQDEHIEDNNIDDFFDDDIETDDNE